MLPNTLVGALQGLRAALSPTDIRAKTDAKLQAATDAPKLQIGQQLNGLVQAKEGNGAFRIQVAGQTIQLRLANDPKIGSNVRLEVLTTQPKITFGVVASQTPISAMQQIGPAAQLLSSLAEQPLEQVGVQQTGRSAIWSVPDQKPNSQTLANALRDALGNSGLFYESHQAQWVRGERSVTQLLQEPQNQLPQKHPQPTNGAENMAFRASNDNQPVARELLPMVQQQLHTLESNQLVWHGQVWPGQQMSWEVQAENEHQQHSEDSQRQWQTEMNLDLPQLGDVSAKLQLGPHGLNLQLHSSNPASAELFRRHLPELEATLKQAGLTLLTSKVEAP